MTVRWWLIAFASVATAATPVVVAAADPVAMLKATPTLLASFSAAHVDDERASKLSPDMVHVPSASVLAFAWADLEARAFKIGLVDDKTGMLDSDSVVDLPMPVVRDSQPTVSVGDAVRLAYDSSTRVLLVIVNVLLETPQTYSYQVNLYRFEITGTPARLEHFESVTVWDEFFPLDGNPPWPSITSPNVAIASNNNNMFIACYKTEANHSHCNAFKYDYNTERIDSARVGDKLNGDILHLASTSSSQFILTIKENKGAYLVHTFGANGAHLRSWSTKSVSSLTEAAASVCHSTRALCSVAYFPSHQAVALHNLELDGTNLIDLGITTVAGRGAMGDGIEVVHEPTNDEYVLLTRQTVARQTVEINGPTGQNSVPVLLLSRLSLSGHSVEGAAPAQTVTPYTAANQVLSALPRVVPLSSVAGFNMAVLWTVKDAGKGEVEIYARLLS